MTELLTPQDFVKKYPSFKLGGIRNIIFYGEKNGVIASGGVCRLGRKVLINTEKFFAWVQTNPNTRGKK